MNDTRSIEELVNKVIEITVTSFSPSELPSDDHVVRTALRFVFTDPTMSEELLRVALTNSEISVIQDALDLHPLTYDGNVLSSEDRWERDQLRSARAKIDRAYERVMT